MTMRRPLTGRATTQHARPITAAATAAVCVTLLLASCSSGSDSVGGSATTATTPSTAASTASPSTTKSPTTTATPTRTPLATTSTAHTEPWNDKNADFGYVLSARSVSEGVEITFDRATWLLASQVPAWNKANPGYPVVAADDYAIGNLSTRKRTFLVRTGAKIFGSILLSDQPEPKRITASQLVSRMASAPAGVTCWLYHQYGGLTGDVVQFEEQYRP
jgi:hypothetical protein